MKMTVKELAKWHLLKGDHINKGEFHQMYHTFTLTQRIEEIRKEDGWAVLSKSIPGRNGMVEYWLDPAEIARIKGETETVEPRKDGDEELRFAGTKSAEQLGIGLLGGHNY